MAISGISTSAAQDPEVKQLKGKINDWETCPTTDPQTKRAIVGRLQVQLDSVTSALQSHDKAKESQMTGLGEAVDIRA